MNLRSIFAIVIAGVVAVWIVARYRTLQRLQVEQARLQVEVAEAAKLRAALEQAKPASPAASDSPLTGAERTELLRLRGEMARLRRELAQPSSAARAPRASQSLPAPATSDAQPAEEAAVTTREQILAKMNSGRQWMLALILHAEDNAGQLPATLADAASYSGGAAGADGFEVLFTGNLRSVASPSTEIVLREKEPWKGPRGRWSRTYAFADGHTEIASSETEDFTAWEERKKNPPAPPPGQ